MPKASRKTASIRQEIPGAVSLTEDFGLGWTVNFEHETADVDTTESNKGLPNDQCQTPHLGYVIAGRITYRTNHGDEVFEAGDAYQVEPGHTSFVQAGTEYVEFSPTDLQVSTYRHVTNHWDKLADLDVFKHFTGQ